MKLTFLSALLFLLHVNGLQIKLEPGKVVCVEKQAKIDFALLIDIALSSDNTAATMDVQVNSKFRFPANARSSTSNRT